MTQSSCPWKQHTACNPLYIHISYISRRSYQISTLQKFDHFVYLLNINHNHFLQYSLGVKKILYQTDICKTLRICLAFLSNQKWWKLTIIKVYYKATIIIHGERLCRFASQIIFKQWPICLEASAWIWVYFLVGLNVFYTWRTTHSRPKNCISLWHNFSRRKL